ncbi:MAG: SDR family NAD(P)-dependent oxidoreductase [Phocaeicola sp.]
MRKNIAVILAGGIGSRLGLSTPKQFFKVAGKMVVEHTIDAFEAHSQIDEIAVVSNPFYQSDFESMILKNEWKKVKKILKGGAERYHSSLSAIKAYEGSDVNLIFHDAVRPLVSQRILNDVVSSLQQYEAIDVAMPATDTIIEVAGEFISQIPDRSKLQRGQTPQAFHIETIRKAYEIALGDEEFKVTDDCGVVVKYLPQTKVYVVKGEESNMKLTYKEDTYLLDKFFQLRKSELKEVPLLKEQLQGKVAIIFGGSCGIGASISELLLVHGVRVVNFSRTLNGVDVGRKEEVARALKQVYEEMGRIDYVINTAGVLHREPLVTTDYQTICDSVNTNYMGTIHVALESYNYLKESKGKLLFFTSSSYTRGRAFYSIYSSTKAAIVNFVQAIAQEWEAVGIGVNCINPERTKTPMRVKNFGMEEDETLLTPHKVAYASIQTLLSEFTGQVIDVKREDK